MKKFTLYSGFFYEIMSKFVVRILLIFSNLYIKIINQVIKMNNLMIKDEIENMIYEIRGKQVMWRHEVSTE